MSKSISSLDVLGETRRALRILRRVEQYLKQRETRERRVHQKRAEREQAEREREEMREQVGAE